MRAPFPLFNPELCHMTGHLLFGCGWKPRYEHIYEDNFAGEPGIGTHYIVLAYEVRLASTPETLPRGQHNGYRWLTPVELLADPQVHQNTKNYFNETGSTVEYARSQMKD